MIVMKFGGTSVDGPERLAAVAAIVGSASGERPVVVTSAMRGVTDALARMLELARTGRREQLEAELDDLRARHLEVAGAVAPGDAPLVEALEAELRELRVVLRGVRLLGQLTPRAADAVLGTGELLAQNLLAAAVAAEGGAPALVDSRVVLVTDDRFGAARPDVAATRRRAADAVVPLVEGERIPVMGGYLGATADGAPTTLGRGGSDLSASILGLALQASRIEIWTDVDGLMSADPRVVPGALPLGAVTFREAAELAGFGAKVLHPAAIDPAISGGIDVVVRNSLAPQRSGTRIGPSGRGTSATAAVASRAGMAVLRVRAPGRSGEPGFAAQALAALAGLGLSPVALIRGPVGLDLLIEEPAEPSRVEQVLEQEGCRTEYLAGRSTVAVIGEKLVERSDTWKRLAARCGKTPSPWFIHGPHGASIAVVVPGDRERALVHSLHDEFVGSDAAPSRRESA